MRSALFVDFDNVYTGLKRLSPAYTEAFAQDPSQWLAWLTDTLESPTGAGADQQRRILVRRCYLNPVMYQRHRIGFSRAGFEIVDCPPMTSAGKTSTDIHMVLDIIDVLQAHTRYDEFIVFSADADFTPVLRKLRRDDRRTTMFAAGATSASYDASADLIIDPEAFIHDALRFDEEEAFSEAPDAEDLMTQARNMTRATVNEASQPVPLPILTKILATRLPALPSSDWAGHGTFTAFLKALALEPLRIDRETNTLLDPQRLPPPRSASAGSAPIAESGTRPPPVQAPAPEASTPCDALSPPVVSQKLERLIGDMVAGSSRPVSTAMLAQRARSQFRGIEATWLGHGSWRKLLESLSPPKVTIIWEHGGWALDTARHKLALMPVAENPAPLAPPTAPLPAEPIPVAPMPDPRVRQMLAAIDLPLLDPIRYQAQLQSLSAALDMLPYDLSVVTKAMRDHCANLELAVTHNQCQHLLRTLVFNGFNPQTDPHSLDDLVSLTCAMVVSACEREGMPMEDGDRDLLRDWVSNRMETAPMKNPATV